MYKTLIVFRLYDIHYGTGGNPKSLKVYMNKDKSLSYSFYGGWQDTGVGFAISNLQLKRSLPLTTKDFTDVKSLAINIKLILSTGVGSRHVDSMHLINDFSVKNNKRAKGVHELKREAESVFQEFDNAKVNAFETISKLKNIIRNL